MIGCQYNGDCERCTEMDCVATIPQILRFYSREENETRKKYGRKSDEQLGDDARHRKRQTKGQ